MRLQGEVPKYLDRVIEIAEHATVVIHKVCELAEGNNHTNARSFLYKLNNIFVLEYVL